jgi:hypothetical protein
VKSYLNVYVKSNFRVSYWYENSRDTKIIHFQDGLEVKLNTDIPETLKIGSDGVNMDYNGKYLVYYEINKDESNLVLHIYAIT